jgi:hypothetical protein
MKIIMGHECIWGTVCGDQKEEGRGRQKILSSVEDETMMHVYI